MSTPQQILDIAILVNTDDERTWAKVHSGESDLQRAYLVALDAIDFLRAERNENRARLLQEAVVE